jgi:hypothetical protein
MDSTLSYSRVAKNIENNHNSFNDKYEFTWLIGPFVVGKKWPKVALFLGEKKGLKLSYFNPRFLPITIIYWGFTKILLFLSDL